MTLRLPSREAGDYDALASYSEEEGGLDGAWVPMIPGAAPERWAGDWLEGWAGRPATTALLLVVVECGWNTAVLRALFVVARLACRDKTAEDGKSNLAHLV